MEKEKKRILIITNGTSGLYSLRRELLEETGIEAAEEEFVLIAHRWGTGRGLDVYLLHRDVPLEEVHLQPGETSDVRWCTVEEYEKVIADGRMAGPIAVRYMDLRETVLEYVERWRNDH